VFLHMDDPPNEQIQDRIWQWSQFLQIRKFRKEANSMCFVNNRQPPTTPQHKR